MEFECQECGEMCTVDGEYPKYLCWCNKCNDYAKGFDPTDYATNITAFLIDQAKEQRKYGKG